VSPRSHGDGRRMAIGEAVERRARTIRFHGSLEAACDNGMFSHPESSIPNDAMPRAWNGWTCHFKDDQEECFGDAAEAEDVDVDRGEKCIVPCCVNCRGRE
jgi:hypothetical protein